MRMDDVYTHIAAHQDAALAELRAFCAQPSVSTEGRGMAEMAALVAGAGAARLPRREGSPGRRLSRPLRQVARTPRRPARRRC